MDASLPHRIRAALQRATAALLAERHACGVWRGKLSSSALSTATAIQALRLTDTKRHEGLIHAGLKWLAAHQHPTGGWGDTSVSLPNISTTLLCWSAFTASGPEFSSTVDKCAAWIEVECGGTQPGDLATTLRRRYGKDQTFSVPILMMCALGGRLGPSPDCWKLVPQLPFQLAALPRKWFAALSLPVVSYALPALIAIGQVRHFHAPSGLGRPLRSAVRRKTLALLQEIQPSGGGFLEATPLTSFVTMALAGMNLQEHPVAIRSVEFLTHSARADGSWPIDTDLATWGTTLAVKALGPEAEFDRRPVLDWLLGQQHAAAHPYTLSAPGGWAWTDLPGGVPDADDTSGALLALDSFGNDSRIEESVRRGAGWLVDLQNRDGGMPTFCRGWGALPFDRSTPEITAHALAAWTRWPEADPRIPASTVRALRFLEKSQANDGSWEPLWFGNQWCEAEVNRVYGAAAVLRDLSGLSSASHPRLGAMRRKAADFLLSSQHPCGGWGGTADIHSSIEETSLAITALTRFLRLHSDSDMLATVRRGVERLLNLTNEGTEFPAAPIGLYFARLWYYERLYPMIWSVAALREVADSGVLELPT